jgi:VanZ family protein
LNSWLPFFRNIFPSLQSFDPMHYAAYFLLSLTVAYAFGDVAFTWRGCLWNVVICVLYGLSDEWHQAYVPNRSPDPLDLWHDTVGAVAACVLLLLAKLYRIRKKRV